MKEKIKTAFSIIVLLLAIPYLITVIFQGDGGSILPQGELEASNEEENSNGGVSSDEESLVLGILAKQISPSHEPEALKAQAIIARTNLKDALEKQAAPPASLSQEELLKGDFKALSEAVKATEGKVLRCQDSYIYAAFHAVSAGRTRNGEEFGYKDMPWLEAVDSYMDITSLDFLTVTFFTPEELEQALKESFSEAPLSVEQELLGIQITGRDGSDYVSGVNLGGKEILGEEFRNALSLNSPCFYLAELVQPGEVGRTIRVVTKGLGHGLGLSQYGANEMAKEGQGFEEILNYYFKNIEISE